MPGFVTVYTTDVGLESFIVTGSCTAKVQPTGDWVNQLTVPREAIKNFKLDSAGFPPVQVSVDVR
jgi:hypothetical protein